MLKIGDKMPDFEVVDQDGNQVSSKDLIGKKTVVYFYPKDNTSGCTAKRAASGTIMSRWWEMDIMS